MATHSTGLGKGLDALIRETQDHPEGDGVRMLPLRDILPNPRQPRRNFYEKPLEELAASIRSQGLLQPLLVRPIGATLPGKYEIVAGERRWRACQMVGLTEVPVLIRTFSAQDTLAAALIENIQREALNPIEEAQGLQILKEEFGLSQDDLAQKLGKSRSSVANSLRLLTLSESIRPLLADGKLSAGHARALLSVADTRAQEYLKNLILESKLSVRETEGLAAGWKETGRFELSGFNDKGESAAFVQQQEPGSKSDAEGRQKSSQARKSKPQSARIFEIQNRIGGLYKVPVRETGKESKGKSSFSYGSKEELDTLLKRLFQSTLESESLVTLDSTVREALKSSDTAALDGNHMDPLEGADLPAHDNSAG
jgi:ParB family chromosome partitioning protein